MAAGARGQTADAIKLEHRTQKKVERGSPSPLGATLSGDGVNFAIHSAHATAVFVLLFDTPDGAPTDIIQLQNRDKSIWHAKVAGLKAGQLYGYKVRGENRPELG